MLVRQALQRAPAHREVACSYGEQHIEQLVDWYVPTDGAGGRPLTARPVRDGRTPSRSFLAVSGSAIIAVAVAVRQSR